MKYFIISTFIVFLLYSCKVKEYNHSELVSIEENSITEGNLLDSMSCRYIRLETNVKCSMAGIKRIIKDGDILFILDNKQNVFEFDTNGHFIRKIGSKGGAKQEYIKLMDIFVDKENRTVNIIDFSRNDCITYNYDGEFIRRKSMPKGIFNGVVSVEFLDNTLYCYNSNWEKGNTYNFSILDMTTSKVTDAVPYRVLGQMSSSKERARICVRKNDVLAVASFSDTIYSLTKNGASPLMCLNGPLRKCDDEDFEDLHPEIEPLICRDFLKKKKTIGLSFIFATDSIISFQYGAPIINVMYTYDLYAKQGKKMLANNSFSCSIIYSDESCFIAMKSIEECQRINDPTINALIGEASENDNPVLAIYQGKR